MFHDEVVKAVGDLTEPTLLYVDEPGFLRPTDVAELLGRVLATYRASERSGLRVSEGQFVLASPSDKRRFSFDALLPPGAPPIFHFADSESAALRLLQA